MTFMYTTSDIYPVSDFNRKPAEHIKRLQETRRPEVLTVNGKAALVMLAPDVYDALLQQAELLKSLQQIEQANADFEQERSRPASEAFAELRHRLKIQHPNAEV
ncbi:MAG: type II toxin-antitoxin system Phd/YefM family antitoxin [Cyanobacteria bacterium P01_A01_bin.37]